MVGTFWKYLPLTFCFLSIKASKHDCGEPGTTKEIDTLDTGGNVTTVQTTTTTTTTTTSTVTIDLNSNETVPDVVDDDLDGVSSDCGPTTTTTTTTTTLAPRWNLNNSVAGGTYEKCGTILAPGAPLPSGCECSAGYEPNVRMSGEALAQHGFDPDAYNLQIRCAWTFKDRSGCLPCLPGRYKKAPGNHICVECTNGLYSGCGLESCFGCPPGMTSSIGAAGCTPCPKGTYGKTAETGLGDVCATCPANTESPAGSTEKEACECKPSFYGNPNDDDLPTMLQKCNPCPPGAICPGGNWPKAKPYAQMGFYDLSDALSKEISFKKKRLGLAENEPYFVYGECRAKEACQNAFGQACAPGHAGTLCDTCIDGYYKPASNAKCKKCPDVFWNLVFIGGAAVFIGLSIFILVYTILHNKKGGAAKPMQAIIMKIFFSYIVLTSSALTITEMELPQSLNAYGGWIFDYLKDFKIQEVLTQNLLSVDCMYALLKFDFMGYAKTATQKRLFINLLALPGLLVIIFIFEIISCILQRILRRLRRCYGTCRGKGYTYVKPLIPCGSLFKWSLPYGLVLYFFVHPMLVNESLRGMFCVNLHPDFPESTFFTYDVDEPCDNSTLHIRFAGLAGLFFWSIVIPFRLWKIMKKNKEQLQDDDFKRRWGFMYNGYEPRCSSWETLIFIRKLLIVAAFVIPGMNQLERMMLLLVVGILFLWAHVYFEPYDNRAYFLLDRLETNMLWSFVITLTGGLCLNPQIVGDSNKQDLEFEIIKILVLLAHVRFLLILLMKIGRETIGKLFCPIAVQSHRIKYDPITREFDLHKLRSHERSFFVAVISDSLVMHLEQLNYFSFQYIEAAVKEGFTPFLTLRAKRRKDKERINQLIREKRKQFEEEHATNEGGGPMTSQKKQHCEWCRDACSLFKELFKTIFNKPWKKKPKQKNADKTEEKVEEVVDEEPVFCDWWTDGLGVEKLQLEMQKQFKAPVQMFLDDQKRANEPVNPFLTSVGTIHQGTGLSEKTTYNIQYRTTHSMKREKRAKQREEQRAPAKKKASKKNQFDDLFGAEEVIMEFNEGEQGTADQEGSEGEEGADAVLTMWEAPDWLQPPKEEEDVPQRAKRVENAHDRVKAAVQRFDERFWGSVPDRPDGMEGPPERQQVTDEDEEPDAFWTPADLDRFPEKADDDADKKGKGKKK